MADAQPPLLNLSLDEAIAYLDAEIVRQSSLALSAWRQAQGRIAAVKKQKADLLAAQPVVEPPAE